MKRQNLRTVSLIVVTFTYLLFGAAIFGYLESEHELRQREALELIELIVKRKYNISEDDFTVLTTTVIKSVPHRAGIQWKFPGAFYFATTVVTTIGYGHSTPATMAGRSFCMIYALIGIPLGLVMFQSIGERLNTFVGAALGHAKRCFKLKNAEVTQTNLVMVVLVLSTILMTSMAAVFAKYERWEYFDALYYCFITLTTIGFGDYVALQKESALQSKPEYVILSLIFILFGLSVVSSAVNLLVLKFLTLNTEDERRDEQLRYTATLNPIQLEGDVITSAAGKLEYMRSDKSMSMQMSDTPGYDPGQLARQRQAQDSSPPTTPQDTCQQRPLIPFISNKGNYHHLARAVNYTGQWRPRSLATNHLAAGAGHPHLRPPAKTTLNGSSSSIASGAARGVGAASSPVSSSGHLSNGTQQIRRRRADNYLDQTTSIVEIHHDDQEGDNHCSTSASSSSASYTFSCSPSPSPSRSPSSLLPSSASISWSSCDNHLHCDNLHHRRRCKHPSRPHRRQLVEHSSGKHLCDRRHRPHHHHHYQHHQQDQLHLRHLHRFQRDHCSGRPRDHQRDHHQRHQHRHKLTKSEPGKAMITAHSNEQAAGQSQLDGHLRRQQLASCLPAPNTSRPTTRGAQLSQRPLAQQSEHRPGGVRRPIDTQTSREHGNQTKLAPTCSCDWPPSSLRRAARSPAASELQPQPPTTNSCLLLDANNLHRQHLASSSNVQERQISRRQAYLSASSTPTIGTHDEMEQVEGAERRAVAPTEGFHRCRFEPLAREDGRTRKSNGNSAQSAPETATLSCSNRSTSTLNDDYRYYPPDATHKRDARSSSSTTATTTTTTAAAPGEFNQLNLANVMSSASLATWLGVIGDQDNHDDDAHADSGQRPSRSRSGSQKSRAASLGQRRGPSSGQQQSTSLALGAPTTTTTSITKLVCKCCCQHEECIKHALEGSQPNRPIDLNSTLGANDNSDRRRQLEGASYEQRASISGQLQQQEQEQPPADDR